MAAVAEAKLLCKYGGLWFYDIDEKKMCHLSTDELVWLGKWKNKDGGWGLKGYDEDWNALEDNRKGHEKPGFGLMSV